MITREEYEQAKAVCEEFEKVNRDHVMSSFQDHINNISLFDRKVRVVGINIHGDEGSFVLQGRGQLISICKDVMLEIALIPDE